MNQETTHIKLYPVCELYPSIQSRDKVSTFQSVYSHLPNFHAINYEEGTGPKEAFTTGKMGSHGFDYNHQRLVLEFAAKHKGALSFILFFR